jgi:hypothetical protein
MHHVRVLGVSERDIRKALDRVPGAKVYSDEPCKGKR